MRPGSWPASRRPRERRTDDVVDGPPAQVPAQVVGQDLHVAREHDEVDLVLLDALHEPRLGLRLGVGGDRHVLELEAVGLHEWLGIEVVGDDQGHLDLQVAGPRAEQQVVEAVQRAVRTTR